MAIAMDDMDAVGIRRISKSSRLITKGRDSMKRDQWNIRQQKDGNGEYSIPMREVDTGAYLDIMKELVQEGKSVSITVSGSSMSPFLIHRRDRVFFEKPARSIRQGDIVFYQRENGRYVMHRVWKVKPKGYYMVGDAQTEIEGPVPEKQIFARITKCERKGRMLSAGNFWWFFFEKVWIRIVPFRPWILGSYERIVTLFHGR